jgi:F-type H+-transporting ATPase subunit gamma
VPSLRDIRRQIASRRNIQKVTRAMQVVSATKMRRAQQAVLATRPYAEKMLEVLQSVSERVPSSERHPYLAGREGDRALVVVITADRGLVGALNSNTLRAVNRYLLQHHAGRGRFVAIGRKGRDFLVRLGREVVAEETGIPDRPGIARILPVIRVALDEYDQDRCDTVLLAYAHFVSTLRQEAVVRTLIPVEVPTRAAGGPSGDYIYEPDPETVLDALLPRYVESQVFQALLENQASEHSARMIAMQNATNAAGDMIRELTLTANKVRQASITAELMDIVNGAEALRGS